MRPLQLEEALMFHGMYRQPVIALSAPGIGKSSIYRKVFRRLGLPHHTINLALSDGTDMKGLPSFIKDEQGRDMVRWVKEQAFLTDKPMAVFIDEIFQGMTQVQNAAAPIILENRVDDVFLPHGSWVCGASNRMEDKAGTNRTPSHIPNRATILMGPDANVDELAEYLIDGGSSREEPMAAYQEPLPLPAERDIRVIQFLRMKPSAISEFDPNKVVNATPRQWEWVAQFLPVMPESVMFDIIAGRVGDGYAAELKGFIKIAEQLPPREKILMDPKKAPVPEEPSALYLVTGMLAQAASAANFDSICTYMMRTPPEFQAMCVKDAMRQHPEITSAKAFVSWGVKFADVLR